MWTLNEKVTLTYPCATRIKFFTASFGCNLHPVVIVIGFSHAREAINFYSLL